MAKISVIVPVYNVEQYIEGCIRSILAQTFRDFELILVDDGSPDRSIERAEALLSASDIPYQVIRQKNKGLAAAREAGIQAAKSEWISCVDSDDTISPAFLAELYSLAITNNTDLAVVGYQMVSDGSPACVDTDAERLSETEIMSRKDTLHKFLIREFAPVLPGILIRRSFLLNKKITNAEGCRFSEDAYYMWQLFFYAERIAVSKRKLYYYLIRRNSIMNASSAEKILTGFQAITELVSKPEISEAVFPEKRFLLSRWVLAALHSAAKITDYSTFLFLAKEMEYVQHMSVLKHFPEKRTRIISRVLKYSPWAFWKIFQILSK